MKPGECAYPDTFLGFSILQDNPIDPLQEFLPGGEVTDDNTNDLLTLGVPDDHRLICFDDILEAVWVELMKWFPCPATSAIRVWCCPLVLFPDGVGFVSFVDVVTRRRIFFLHSREMDCLDTSELASFCLGTKANCRGEVIAAVFVYLRSFCSLVKSNTDGQGNFVFVVPAGKPKQQNRVYNLVGLTCSS